jgi:UDP-N-acetylmuramoylalanine--D-glutamate ligase
VERDASGSAVLGNNADASFARLIDIKVEIAMFAHLDRPATLILGLGVSGLAMARWCHTRGCRVRVADTRESPEKLSALPSGIEYVSGPFTPSLLDRIQLVGVSPGLALHEPNLAALLAQARTSGLPSWGEMAFFAQALQYLRQNNAYSPKLIAITGTNGKTTVTQLTGKLCAAAGKSVAVAGNIGTTALDTLSSCMTAQSYPDIWVLELSSFQLMLAHPLQADAAAILNLGQDHLDWHENFAAYAAAKARIFAPQTVPVVCRDDPAVMEIAQRLAKPETITVGTDVPGPGDFGLLREKDAVWLAHAERKLMPSDTLRIRGQHNATNALFSLALVHAVGLPYTARLSSALREYSGGAHRLQPIACIDGVQYINDSKGTNIHATLAALKALGAGGQARVVWIAGGEAKGQDCMALCDDILRCVRAVLLIGRDAGLIRAALQASAYQHLQIELLADLPFAVKRAAELAQSGDTVLLSPACSSFDMFSDYVARGECFIAAVRALSARAGVLV